MHLRSNDRHIRDRLYRYPHEQDRHSAANLHLPFNVGRLRRNDTSSLISDVKEIFKIYE